ncbi:hypothetical protein UT300007_27070 [Clostridium sp. CTA-7]
MSNFKEGEKSVVKVKLYGGIDYVTIEFPEELTDLNYKLNTYKRFTPEKTKEFDYEFFVPMGSEHKVYTVDVTGYKKGKEKIVYPKMEVIGNILDKVRTRIR